MAYDRWGQTPQMARRQRIYDWLCVAALGLIVVTTFAIAALVGDAPYYLQKFVDSRNLLGEGNAPFTDTEMQDMLIAARTLAPRTALRGCSTEAK